jgi:hypothetical protein
MRSPSDLSAEEALAVAVVVLYLAWEASRAVTSTSSTHTHHELEEEWTRLGVCDRHALDRLEDGESIVIERWHGHNLEVRADRVIDADTLDEEPDETEGDPET